MPEYSPLEKLGLAINATGGEIKHAYFKYTRMYHEANWKKDASNDLKNQWRKLLAEVTESYGFLKDEATRTVFKEFQGDWGTAWNIAAEMSATVHLNNSIQIEMEEEARRIEKTEVEKKARTTDQLELKASEREYEKAQKLADDNRRKRKREKGLYVKGNICRALTYKKVKGIEPAVSERAEKEVQVDPLNAEDVEEEVEFECANENDENIEMGVNEVQDEEKKRKLQSCQ